jgi:hypothetical protein
VEYNWADKAISVLTSKGIIHGTSDTTFTPGAKITRADYLTLLMRTLGLTSKDDSNFSDVKVSDYYFDALRIAKSLGIVQGVGDNHFNPNQQISRQDMMVMASRALQLSTNLHLPNVSKAEQSYSDSATVASYAKESIDLLVKLGLIEGDNGMVKPEASASRAETAVLMYRIFQLL